MTTRIELTVNGRVRTVDVVPHHTLLEMLRDDLTLTGSKECCLVGECGACTVIVDGAAVRACLMLAVQADGARVTTVEGLASGDRLSPLQTEFRRHHALQCGFCTPGILTTAHALLTNEPDADRPRIREVLSGNLCRCTGYVPIVEAVYAARDAYRSERGTDS